MTLCIKTGMDNEATIARAYAAPGTLVLQGIYSAADLDKAVPSSCTGVISFGMCGGLRPKLPIVGQTLIAWPLITPDKTYMPDEAWVKRLFAATKAYCQPYFSSGEFNTANTPAQRAALFAQYGAWAIDDESNSVAEFSAARGIPFVVMRNVSDAWNDNVSITSNILNANGGVDPLAVLSDLVEYPEEMMEITRDYFTSNGELRTAAVMVGPTFQAP